MMTAAGSIPVMTSPILLFERTREIGVIREVADGILWIRIPLPFSPHSINAYALRDVQGWTVIDTGAHDPAAFDCWREVLNELASGGGVTRIVATHSHPDHIGGAGWLADVTGAPLWTSQVEYMLGNLYAQESFEDGVRRNRNYFQLCDTAPLDIAALEAGDPSFEFMEAMPTQYRRIRHGETIRIGNDDWQVLMGEGHSPEHATMFSPTRGILIAGDQFLPRIVPIVNTYTYEPEANPTESYLRTMAHFRHIPEDTMVLPGHGTPFAGLHVQIRAAEKLFAGEMDALYAACRTPRTVAQLVHELGLRRETPFLLRTAISESSARLHALIGRGRMRRSLADGKWLFERL